MTDESFSIKGQLIIEEVYGWMDGGSVTLTASDEDSAKIEIEFVQKVVLNKWQGSHYPGSLLFNKKEVEIRSEMETKILQALRNAVWARRANDDKLSREMISDCIDFIASDHYISVSRKVGRIN